MTQLLWTVFVSHKRRFRLPSGFLNAQVQSLLLFLNCFFLNNNKEKCMLFFWSCLSMETLIYYVVVHGNHLAVFALFRDHKDPQDQRLASISLSTNMFAWLLSASLFCLWICCSEIWSVSGRAWYRNQRRKRSVGSEGGQRRQRPSRAPCEYSSRVFFFLTVSVMKRCHKNTRVGIFHI